MHGMKIIISGGGTGGHIFPALAIAEALKKKLGDVDILFVGAKGRMEMKKVPLAGYPIIGLWISGFQRKWSLKNLLFPIKLVVSLMKAGWIIKRFKPDMVVGVGGYASGPILEMAYRLNIPAIIQEQNSFPGITNRLLAKKVRHICVAYEQMQRFFPADKITLTGNPIRKAITQVKKVSKEEAYRHFGLDPSCKTIGIFGGSLGARTLNEAVESAAELIGRQEGHVQVLWQMGEMYEKQYQTGKAASNSNVKAMAFVQKMDWAYAISDLVICRAGALTIAEVSVVGLPVILVPSPNVSEDHQRKNALSLVDRDAAVMIEDDRAVKELIPAAIALLNEEKQLAQMSRNIAFFGKTTASDTIADIIVENMNVR